MSAKKVESMIHADGVDISVVTTVGSEDDYISLTDMARRKNPVAPKDVVKNWLRIRSTIEYLGLWEELNNPNFKGVEFDSFKNPGAGEKRFYIVSATMDQGHQRNRTYFQVWPLWWWDFCP